MCPAKTELSPRPDDPENGPVVTVPDFCLLLLIGTSSSGKSGFARQHFSETEIVSSDHCRAMICDDENDQSINRDCFELFHTIIEKRLRAGRLTVADATNVRFEARKALLELARRYHAPALALVFNIPLADSTRFLEARADRPFGPEVLKKHHDALQASLGKLRGGEGFAAVHEWTSPEEISRIRVVREPSARDRKAESGPFDIIGDVHGCLDELVALIRECGYHLEDNGVAFHLSHPEGRKLAFVGDLLDRGPDNPGVLRLVMDAVDQGIALCVNGNHDDRYRRYLAGNPVKFQHGLQETVDQMARTDPAFQQRALTFLSALPSHMLLDGGKLAVTHAMLKKKWFGRDSKTIRQLCAMGETNGEKDERGFPVRLPWAESYEGDTLIVYGHTVKDEPEWCNRTVCIDTGCVFGGRLTAFRYPEQDFRSVPAARIYYEAGAAY